MMLSFVCGCTARSTVHLGKPFRSTCPRRSVQLAVWMCPRKTDVDVPLQSDVTVHTRETNLESASHNESTRKTERRSKGFSASFWLLNLVTLIWGTQHVVIKSVLENTDSSPEMLNFLRFGISAALLSPVYLLQAQRSARKASGHDARSQGAMLSGAELGFWSFAGFGLQSTGLMFTSAGRSAFLLYLNVKIVPLLARVVFGRRISLTTWTSAAIALFGTCLLCLDSGHELNVGDALSLLAAAASAMFILRLESAAEKYPATDINFHAMWSTTILFGGWLLAGQKLSSSALSLVESWPVFYLSVICTVLTSILQTIGQRSIPAEKAAIIYAMDPVYAVFFSFVFLGDNVAVQGLLGCACIVVAAIVSQGKQ